MTTTRILPGVVLAALAMAGPVAAQYGMPPYAPPGRMAGVVPSVLPSGGPDAGLPGGRTTTADYRYRYATPNPQSTIRPAGADDDMPAGRPPAAADSLQRMTVPPAPGSDPAGTLATAGNAPLPQGAYASPWFTDGPGCCGPLGGNGHVDYELYTQTGPVLVGSNAPFTDHLKTGWMVGGGGRTLFFNQAGDAAWLVDLGLSYQYNRGTFEEIGLFIRQNPTTNQVTGARQDHPDLFVSTRIRALHRTAFNFSFGRDCWLLGNGANGFEDGWNVRVGADIGGRWGTAHVDLVPGSQVDVYSRRQGVFHGLTASVHADVEHPFGGWIWFGGLRVQYGIDWTNIVPPISGDVQFLNLMISTGVRF
jgi:hypothetical protein